MGIVAEYMGAPVDVDPVLRAHLRLDDEVVVVEDVAEVEGRPCLRFL